MNIVELCIRNRTVTLFITFLLLGGGIMAYESLGRLQDPEFTIKDAKVITFYPGATPREVEKEVTDVLETHIQTMGQLMRVTSVSQDGLSIITPTMKYKYDKASLPQVWDVLRRKVNDAQKDLPAGAMPSVVFDDFGDVFGVLLAITGDGYSYRELKDYADLLRKELLQVTGVGKVEIAGAQQEQIFVEISRSRLAQLGLPLEAVYATLDQQNLVADSGSVRVSSEYVTIQPSGSLASVDAIGNVLIRDPADPERLFHLRDIATITRGYQEPPENLIRYRGEQALAVAISTVAGGNVVEMGDAVKAKIAELKVDTPLGMEIGVIAFQSDAVTAAIDNFVENLVESVLIVLVVLMLFMGWRSAALIGAILVVTIFATLIVMAIMDINLQRISLGALIIALGMLVDNAIVVVDGMLMRISQGSDRLKAAKQVVGQNLLPLLGATAIAVLAFVPIGFSADDTGEYCRSLFLVILISLGLSWVTAITITPLLAHMYLKAEPIPEGTDPYGGAFYNGYRALLRGCIRFRYATLVFMVVLLAGAIYGFGLLKNSFFPPSTRPQLMVNYWLPQGSDIRTTSADLKQIEQHILGLEGVTGVSTFIGGGAPRFLLTYVPPDPNSSYGLLLVDVARPELIDELSVPIHRYIDQNFPDAQPVVNKFALGPGKPFKIRARFSGRDPAVVRELAEQAMNIMREDPDSQGARIDWREPVKVLEPQFSAENARRIGVTRPELSGYLKGAFDGLQVGTYREGNKLLPIISRPPADERLNVENIHDVQIWSPTAQKYVPMRQVVDGVKTEWQDGLIIRRNRALTATAMCDALGVLPSELLARIKPKIDAIELPQGYRLEWGGQLENSTRAQNYVAAGVPLAGLVMVLILVMLFNNLRQPLVILLALPLAAIGVSVGLLVTDLPFGFMALLGFLSLSGMLIKNAIVLIDEINAQLAQGKDTLSAIIESGVSRLRPVSMGAATTVMGMATLLMDPFFSGMAVTIVFGLSFATVLTLVIVPVLYAAVFRVRYQAQSQAPEDADSKLELDVAEIIGDLRPQGAAA